MKDLVRALLLGSALICVILVIPLVVAVATSVISFALIIGVVWCVIKVLRHEDRDGDRY